jgi:hypothetical protein
LQLRNHSEKIARAHIEETFPHFVDEIPRGRSPILKQGNKIVARCKNDPNKKSALKKRYEPDQFASLTRTAQQLHGYICTACAKANYNGFQWAFECGDAPNAGNFDAFMDTLDDGVRLDDNKDTGKSLVPEHSQPVHPKTQQKEAKAAVQYIDKVIWKETTGYSLEAALNIGSRRTQARNLFADLDCDEDSDNNVPARKTAARKTAPAE